jgi:hypothetical protein
VKRLVAMAFARTDWSRPDVQGCQMIEGQVRLLRISDQRDRPFRRRDRSFRERDRPFR